MFIAWADPLSARWLCFQLVSTTGYCDIKEVFIIPQLYSYRFQSQKQNLSPLAAAVKYWLLVVSLSNVIQLYLVLHMQALLSTFLANWVWCLKWLLLVELSHVCSQICWGRKIFVCCGWDQILSYLDWYCWQVLCVWLAWPAPNTRSHPPQLASPSFDLPSAGQK